MWLHARRAHLDDAADRVVGELLVGPGADRRLEEGLVGIARRGLELGAAHDDALVGLLDHVHHHVGVLLLRRLGAVALGIGVGRDVEHVGLDHAVDMARDVGGELRVDLVQHVAAVVERPHLAHGLVADTGDDALDVVQHRVDGFPLVVPVALLLRQAVEDRMLAVVLPIRQRRRMRRLVLHVVHARADVDDRLERGMGGDVLDPLAVDPHLAAVADALAVLRSGSDHRCLRPRDEPAFSPRGGRTSNPVVSLSNHGCLAAGPLASSGRRPDQPGLLADTPSLPHRS